MARYKKYYHSRGFNTKKVKSKKRTPRKIHWNFEKALQSFMSGKLSVEKYREIVDSLPKR